jgi:hypothetical protein
MKKIIAETQDFNVENLTNEEKKPRAPASEILLYIGVFTNTVDYLMMR